MLKIDISSYDLVKKSLVKNSFFLLSRQIIVYSLNLIGAIYLARLLSIEDYGLFAVISFIFILLTSFSDAGLVASLIRQKSEPSNYDYSVIFTFQLALSVLVILLFIFAVPFIVNIYHINNHDLSLFYILALSSFLSVFSLIPCTISQRNLLFNKIALFDIIQCLVFNIIVIILVNYGFGLISFSYALLLKIIISNLYIMLASPWKISLVWDWQLVKSHLEFGLHYQGVRIIALFKESFTPIFIGGVVGSVAVGYLNWINLVALFPTMAIFLLQKMYMPYFSKFQSDNNRLSAIVGNMIWVSNFVVAPISILTILLIHPITTVIFGEKWVEALPYFYFIWISNLFVPTASVCIGLFDAVGMSKVNFKYSLLWMLMNWSLGIPAIYLWGLMGFVISVSLTQLTNLLLYRDAIKYVQIKFREIIIIWCIAVFSGLFIMFFFKTFTINNISSLIYFSILTFLTYLILTYLFFRKKFESLYYIFLIKS